MYIQPNILLTPTEKLIKPYECSFIVIEGPNMKSKLSLEGLEIKYDSFYLSQLTLNVGAADQPLMYGFLGENITFLMIRAKYMPLDPNWALETEQYIQYYYKDDPGQVRTMSQMLVLTGNSTNRIPQIYFNNPSTKYNVYLEVLMANLPQANLTNTNQYAENSSFGGLYWNSIISDVVYYSTPTSTGSTELEILDINGNAVAYVPYNNIRTITKINSTTLLIGLDTEEKIKLEFLSEFNCDQANSRINWVLKSTRYRILSRTDFTDVTPPTLNWNDILTGSTTGITSGNTILYLIPSGQTYTSTMLKEIFLSGITDNRDGDISIYDSTVEMYIYGDIVPSTEIDNIGTYNVIFKAKDLANNWIIEQRYVSIYTSELGFNQAGLWDDDGIWIDLYDWVD